MNTYQQDYERVTSALDVVINVSLVITVIVIALFILSWIQKKCNTEHTYAEKQAMYKFNKFKCPMPPVCYTEWSDDDWIAYIDKDGKWTP